jgi:hypothetical protein
LIPAFLAAIKTSCFNQLTFKQWTSSTFRSKRSVFVPNTSFLCALSTPERDCTGVGVAESYAIAAIEHHHHDYDRTYCVTEFVDKEMF